MAIVPANPIVEPGGAGDDVDDFTPALATADSIAVDCDAIADLCVHRNLRELAVARIQRRPGVKALGGCNPTRAA